MVEELKCMYIIFQQSALKYNLVYMQWLLLIIFSYWSMSIITWTQRVKRVIWIWGYLTYLRTINYVNINVHMHINNVEFCQEIWLTEEFNLFSKNNNNNKII